MWLQDALPGVEIENVSSNAVAAERAASCDGCAAIAGERAAAQYGLNVLASRIEDNKENTTRFLVLSRESVAASGKDKTSLLMSCKNEPGSLFKLLKPLHDHGVSMLKIESRPSKIKRCIMTKAPIPNIIIPIYFVRKQSAATIPASERSISFPVWICFMQKRRNNIKNAINTGSVHANLKTTLFASKKTTKPAQIFPIPF